ncbi:MAG: AgmX/PglI C-terminal domain-containing protein [Polyangia bacterium]
MTARQATIVLAVPLACGIAMLVPACGSAPPETTEPEPGATGEGEGGAAEVDDSAPVAVEGVRGSIPQHRVERVFQRKMDVLGECYGLALEDSESIEGGVEVALSVALDGSVEEVFLRGGDLGSDTAERCLVEKVGRMSFPEPAGGPAEVSYPLELEAPYDPPEPIDWGGAEIRAAIGENRGDVERCLGGESGVRLTVWVGSGGRVISSGATAQSADLWEASRCLAEAAAEWSFPDPKQGIAKATVDL